MNAALPRRLFELLTDPVLRHAKVVLVHAGYPWLQEAAFMTNVLPNVYLDVSLVCPATGGALRDISPAGARDRAVHEGAVRLGR